MLYYLHLYGFYVLQCSFKLNVNHRFNVILSYNTVPQVIQPPVDSRNVTFYESAKSVQLMCTLNIDIPSSVTVIWLYNSNYAMTGFPNEVITTGNTTTLVIANPQPSDAGVYQCTFVELNLHRVINLG